MTDRLSLLALVAANLLLAVQTLRHEWGIYEVMLVWWVEVVLLGGYNVLRMLVVGVAGARPLGAWAERWVDLGGLGNRLGLTALGVGFFVVKFGGFALAVGLLVALLPAFLAPEAESQARSVGQALGVVGPGVVTAAGALALSHGISFVRNFLLGREYDRIGVVALAFWPYARMSLVAGLFLAGVVAAALVPGAAGGALLAAFLVLLKLLADGVSHVVEPRWLASPPPPPPPPRP